MSDLYDLFVAFLRVGLFGFGGGPSMIPLIEAEVVDTYAWLTQTEFLDAFAFGNSLPGPIATKLAGYVGYQVAGVAGAAVGLAALTLPTIAAMIGLATLYVRYQKSPLIRDFLRGVRPVIVALLAVVVWEFSPSAFEAFPGVSIVIPIVMAVLTVVILRRTSLHPALLIVIGGVIGLLLNNAAGP